MARRKRPREGPPPDPTGEALRAALAARFPAGLPDPPAPPPPPPPPRRVVGEDELMAAAFASLATGEPLDFAALRVVARLTPAPGPKRQAPTATPARSDMSGAPPRDGTAPPSATAPAPAPSDSSPARPLPATAPLPAPSDRSPAPPAAPDPGLTALRERAWAGGRWRDDPSAPFDRAAASAELIARARRGRLPTLRIRGLRREPALELVAAFVARERAAGSRYLRIITGKGLGSPGDPVLKEALAEWCASLAGEQHVVAWAPELAPDGEFGAIVVQLRPGR